MKASQIFASFYPKHCTLIDYLSDIKDEICQSTDQPCYTDMLKNTVVCYHGNRPTVKSLSPNISQWFSIEEVIQRIIKMSCQSVRGSSSNVLSLGYEMARNKNNSTGCGSLTASTIVNEYPNSNVRLLLSKPWQTLYRRIGDDLMIRLLKDVSLFVLVGHSCYIQVSGYPMYSLECKESSPERNAVQKEVRNTGTTRTGDQTHRSKSQPSERKTIEEQRSEVYKDVPGVHHHPTQNVASQKSGETTIDDQASTRPAVTPTPRYSPVAITMETTIDDQASTRPAVTPTPRYSPVAITMETTIDDQASTRPAVTPTPRYSPVAITMETTIDDQASTRPAVTPTPRYSPVAITMEMTIDDQASTRPAVTPTPRYSPVAITLSPEHPSIQFPRMYQHVDFTRIQQHAIQSVSSLTSKETTTETPCGLHRNLIQNTPHQEPMDFQMNSTSKCTATQQEKRRVDVTEPMEETALGKGTRHMDKRSYGKRKQSHHSKKRAVKKPRLSENALSRPGARKKEHGSPTEFNSRIFSFYFPHTTLMYSTDFKDRFPPKHIMSSIKPNNRGATNLIRAIFFDEKSITQSTQRTFLDQGKGAERKKAEFTSKRKKSKIQRLPKRFLKMRGLIVQFVRRHKRCRFNGLLKHHCRKELQQVGVSDSKGGTSVLEEKDNQQDTSNCEEAVTLSTNKELRQYQLAVSKYTPTYQVFRFVKAVCNRVVPKELWGTEKNKRAFYKNLDGFIKLKKSERFSLGQTVDRMKIACCDWVKLSGNEKQSTPLSESEKQKEVLYKWIWWLVRCYIMVILKSFFYITEGASQSKEIFFYRKPVWKIIQEFGIKTVKNTLLRPISKEEAASLLDSNASLGYSFMRFIPKASKVRPIINMRMRPEAKKGKKFQLSINSKLRNVFEIIKFENARKTLRVNSTVFGVDDVYKALKSFITKRETCNDSRPLCLVHVDINRCFDSILLDKLYRIMKAVFKEEEYIVRRFVVIKSSNDKEKGLKNVVFVDQVCYIREERDHILAILKKHLFGNIVKIGNNYYKQVQGTVPETYHIAKLKIRHYEFGVYVIDFQKKEITQGIAQGSVLSNYLCSHFYNHMENRHLKPYLKDESSLLMRWVDDFLLMTPNESLADMFLAVMNAGIPKYGCQITAGKTLVNYESKTGIPVRRVSPDLAFPWCGFLIHPRTLNVKVDYSRYEGRQVPDSPLFLSRVVFDLPPFFCSFARRKFQKISNDDECSIINHDLVKWWH
ncbi:hypothetical protein QZH41_006721 [Actinostola sp. cb2023]|nr:hypothetical protein QZH41_006721 [Actinostola sp. cb2023]